ncbi:reverse transcriptase [Caerostris extrusa]|uniref:Reverse transcriptase n=1 Tax=Caerostris extrusa TaxID=172846 RepID=A0AAV4S3K4_CAEEX|nr:reverse transcriptase [Caerostris extrusa]
MYRQIILKDSDFQRIVWRDSLFKPIQDFRLTGIAYGTASAPYLAVKCLQQLAIQEQNFPLALKDFYVDDLMSGANSTTEALDLQAQLIKMLSSVELVLRKWASNCNELTNLIQEDLRLPNASLSIDDDTVKTLVEHQDNDAMPRPNPKCDKISNEALGILLKWVCKHDCKAMPSRKEKEQLAVATNLSERRVSKWFKGILTNKFKVIHKNDQGPLQCTFVQQKKKTKSLSSSPNIDDRPSAQPTNAGKKKRESPNLQASRMASPIGQPTRKRKKERKPKSAGIKDGITNRPINAGKKMESQPNSAPIADGIINESRRVYATNSPVSSVIHFDIYTIPKNVDR